MKKSAVKTVSIIMIISLVGKIMGLARQMLFGFHYGTDSIESAAFTVADQIPKNFLDAMFASVISASFIPVFNEYYEKRGKDEAYKLSLNFINIIFLLTLFVTVVGMMFSYYIAGWYAPGYTQETRLLTSVLLRILFPLLIVSGLTFALTGLLQSLGEFNIPAAISVTSNGIIIIYYIFFIEKYGIYGLSVAYLLGWLSQLLIQIPFLRKNNFKYRFFIDLKDPGIRQIAVLTLPVMISTWIQPLNLTINSRVASTLFDGSGAGINALNYANTLYTVISGVFILSVANVIFPMLSKQSIGGGEGEFGDTVYKTLHTLFYFLIPMSIGMIVLSEPVVRLLFEINGGRFDAFSTAITSRALAMYSIGIIGLGVQTILARGFYALKDGKTPLLTGILAVLINLILSVVLSKYWDVGGIALASSTSFLLISAIMIIVMLKRGWKVFDFKMFLDLLKMAVVGAVMTVIVVLSRNYFMSMEDTFIIRIISVVVPTGIGLVTYIAGTYLLKIYEPQEVFNKLKSKR